MVARGVLKWEGGEGVLGGAMGLGRRMGGRLAGELAGPSNKNIMPIGGRLSGWLGLGLARALGFGNESTLGYGSWPLCLGWLWVLGRV